MAKKHSAPVDPTETPEPVPAPIVLVWTGGNIRVPGLPCHDLTEEDLKGVAQSEEVLLRTDVRGVKLWKKA